MLGDCQLRFNTCNSTRYLYLGVTSPVVYIVVPLNSPLWENDLVWNASYHTITYLICREQVKQWKWKQFSSEMAGYQKSHLIILANRHSNEIEYKHIQQRNTQKKRRKKHGLRTTGRRKSFETKRCDPDTFRRICQWNCSLTADCSCKIRRAVVVNGGCCRHDGMLGGRQRARPAVLYRLSGADRSHLC